MQALLEKNSKLEAAIGAGDRCQQERSQQPSASLSTISFLKQQLKSQQAEINVAQRNLNAEKISRSVLREMCQCRPAHRFSFQIPLCCICLKLLWHQLLQLKLKPSASTSYAMSEVFWTYKRAADRQCERHKCKIMPKF